MIKLSKRLECVASLVKKDDFVHDVGSDHAYLPIFLVKSKIIKKAKPKKNNYEPYLNALENVSKSGFKDQILVYKQDGIKNMSKKVNCLTICGMGGNLIKNILDKDGQYLRFVNHMILQPNNNSKIIRIWAKDNKYRIINEKIIKEEDKFYEIIELKKNKTKVDYSKEDLFFGPILLKEKNSDFIEKWSIELEKLEKIQKQIEDKESLNYKNIEKDINFINKIVLFNSIKKSYIN